MQQPQTTLPRVEMINITKAYGSIRSLRGVNPELAPGEVLGLVGDNSMGKSTLTKVLFGAVIPSSSMIRIDGRQQQFANPADSRRCHIEMVYQDLSLCDTVNAAGNPFMGREPMESVLGIPFFDETKMHADVREMLKGLGISIPDIRPLVRNLFGGQRQAIAIVRAAAFDPKVLVIDEPAAALAAAEVEAVLELIRRVSARGVSMILITHRLQDLFLVYDRIMVMCEDTNVADRRVFDISLSDIVSLIVGEKFTAYSVVAH